MSATMPFRLARAAVFAVVCVGLSAPAHVFGGGSVPVPGLICGFGLAFAAALPLSGRERSFGVILGLLAGLQAGLHLLFSLAHTMSAAEPFGHVHSGLVPGLGMLVLHGWAVGLIAMWLARGEAALWGLLRRLVVRLCLILAVHPDPAWTYRVRPWRAEPAITRSAPLRHALSRRGPPEVVSAA
ncbi:MFS transporter [Acrocarpospora sp. B8E8]|uniref:MFS transporter n=1 Tax=Acrocarpospora sp. B8E8 TaxID=3153572 RepID=UPI00325F0294